MKPLAWVALTSLVVGLVFVVVSLVTWPRGALFEVSTGGNVLGLSIGSALLSLAVTAVLLTMHAKEVGTRTFDALLAVEDEKQERERRESRPLSFRS